MLALLSRLAPGPMFAIAMAVAAIPAGAAGWFARGAVVDWIEIPRLIRTQTEICTSNVEAAAAKARADEQKRMFLAGERATERFLQESQQAADDRAAERQLFEIEVQRYAQDLAQRDGGCPLGADDLDFLGVQHLAAPGDSQPGAGAGAGAHHAPVVAQ